MSTPPPQDPLHDPLLAGVPSIEGYKVLGKTVLLEAIGAGGMGVVYRGWHMAFRIVVAVKVLKPSLSTDRDYVRRFRQEAQAALQITHQNVVRVYDVEERHGLHHLVMEFVDGESARQRVRRLGRLPAVEAATVIAGAADGLAEAHAHGLVHHDVKPANLLIARTGRVKVADLGLVRPAVDGADVAEVVVRDGRRAVLGTPRYLAPELWDGTAPQPAADVWGLGATLYYLVTGRHGLPKLPNDELRRLVRDEPFPTLGGLCKQLPALDEVFERCVDRDPARRYGNAAELRQALAAVGGIDESLLRDPDHVPGGEPAGLPTNEILGRIDEHLRGSASAERPRVTGGGAPAVVRRAVRTPQRRGSGTLFAVVGIVVVLAIVFVLLSQLQRQGT